MAVSSPNQSLNLCHAASELGTALPQSLPFKLRIFPQTPPYKAPPSGSFLLGSGARIFGSPQLPLSFAPTVLCEGLSNHPYLQHRNYLFQSLSHERQQPSGQGLDWSRRPVISKRPLSPSALDYSHLGSCLSPHPGSLHFKMAQSHFTIVSQRLPQPATSRLRTLQD